jgi:hypothetical protein
LETCPQLIVFFLCQQLTNDICKSCLLKLLICL